MRRRIVTLVAVVALVLGGCAGDEGAGEAPPAPGPTGGPIAGQTTPVHTTTTTRPTVTTAPLVVTEPVLGLWPDALGEILVASADGVVRRNADGSLDRMLHEPAEAADVDGAGGLVVMRPPTAYKGMDMNRVDWVPQVGTGQLMAVDPPGVVQLLDVMWLPGEYHGPRFAAVLADVIDAEGLSQCVHLEPFETIPLVVGVGSRVLCRRAADGGLSWVSWSGRFFVLTLATPVHGSWLEFAARSGETLAMVHNPGSPTSTDTEIRLATAVGGTNQVLFVERNDAGYETLVGVDLDDGSEFLRVTLASPGESIARIDAVPGAAVVSRAGLGATGPAPLTPLLIDVLTGAVGTVEIAGVATIPHEDPWSPTLYPPGTTSGGTEITPDLVVTSPLDHARTDERVATFRGWVTPGSTVSVGDYFATVDPNGRWELALVLNPGSNLAGFVVHGAGPADGAVHRVAVFRELEGDPERWLGFYFWVPMPDFQAPFGDEMFDAWIRPAIPTGLLAYELEGSVMAVAKPGVPITHSPEMLWLVEQIGAGPAGYGRVYLVADALLVDPPTGYFFHADDAGRVMVGFAGRTYLADADAGRFVEVPGEPGP